MSLARTAALALILFPQTFVHAQSYEVRVRSFPGVGKSVTVREVATYKVTITEGGKEGKPATPMKTEESREEIYTETTLAGSDREPTRFRRTYEKATVSASGKTVARSYQGRTVLFERHGERWQVRLEGEGSLSPGDSADLVQEAEGRADVNPLLPNKPVGLEEMWTIDPKVLAARFGQQGTLDLSATRGEGVLKSVVEKDGHRVGTVEITLKPAIKVSQGVTFDPPAVMEARFVLETALDGSSTAGTLTMKATLRGRGRQEVGGKAVALEVSLEPSARQERSVEK